MATAHDGRTGMKGVRVTAGLLAMRAYILARVDHAEMTARSMTRVPCADLSTCPEVAQDTRVTLRGSAMVSETRAL
jgi:hypothetical protein